MNGLPLKADRIKGDVYVGDDGIKRLWTGEIFKNFCKNGCDNYARKGGFCFKCNSNNGKKPISKLPDKKDRKEGGIYLCDDGFRKKWDGKQLRKLCFKCDKYALPDGYCKMCSEGKTRVPNTYPEKKDRVIGEIYIVNGERKRWGGKEFYKLCKRCDNAARKDGLCTYCLTHDEPRKIEFKPSVKFDVKKSDRIPGNIYISSEDKRYKWNGKSMVKLCMECDNKSYSSSDDFCVTHGGGPRCQYKGCGSGAKPPDNIFCISHGGGYICQVEGCTTSARPPAYDFCVKHGGGKLCSFKDCKKAAQGKTDFCKSHGGGKRCPVKKCKNAAMLPFDFCITHGGGYRCQFEDCENSTRNKDDEFCVTHGGGSKCTEEGCDNMVASEGLCRYHGGGKKCSNCEEQIVNTRYNPYCTYCYYELNGIPPKTFKMKERHFHEHFQKNVLKDIKFRYDLKIDGGCSRRRPDWFIDMGTHSIIVECDEDQHKERDENCEKTRLYEIFEDLGDRPIVFIRFNPDSYYDKDKNKVEGCFKFERQEKKDGRICVTLRKINKELNRRCKKIEKRIKHWMKNVPTDLFNTEYLYFDKC